MGKENKPNLSFSCSLTQHIVSEALILFQRHKISYHFYIPLVLHVCYQVIISLTVCTIYGVQLSLRVTECSFGHSPASSVGPVIL